MKRSILPSASIAVALLLGVSLSFAAENKAGAVTETKAIGNTKVKEQSAKAKAGKAGTKVKLVDVNSAGKAELKTLPGVDDATADKIIAGRPYLSKADLLTQKVVSSGIYAQIRARVIAKQNKAAAAKLEKLMKERAAR